MGRVKGVALRNFVEWLRADLGPAEMGAVFARLSKAHREQLDPEHAALGILASSWYSAPLVHDLLEALAADREAAELERFVSEGTHFALQRSLTTVHRAILRIVGSPSRHARFCQNLWRTYYDHGRVESVVQGPGRQLITYYDWEAHQALLCRMTTRSDVTIFSLMGLRDVAARQISYVDEGADGCAHEVTWTG